MFRLTIREIFLATTIVALVLGWGLDRWYSPILRDEELQSSRSLINSQKRTIERLRMKVKEISSHTPPPPPHELEVENESLRLEVKLLKKQLLGHE